MGEKLVDGKLGSGFWSRTHEKNGDDKRISPQSRVTARDVAAIAGVSTSAVSRTFTKGASVSPVTRNKVVDAARRLGYRPNLLARSLTTKRTELIGLVSNNFENPLFLEIFDHFTRRLQQRGLQPLLANLTEGEPPDGALNMLRQYSVDGVIVASSSLHRKLLSACAKAGLPAVQAFGRPGGRMRANVVAADNVQGGRVAADLFCERGYRRVAFLGGPLSATSTEDRLEGFRQRLLRERLRPVVEVYANSFSYAAGRTLMQALIKRGGIDGVFCGDDIWRSAPLTLAGSAECRSPKTSASSGSTTCRWRLGRLTISRPFVSRWPTSLGLLLTSSYRLSRSQGDRRLRSFSLARRSFGTR